MSLTKEEICQKLINLNNQNRKEDQFYTRFYRMPENIGNFLSRQVKSVTRPNVEFQVADMRHKGYNYRDKQDIMFGPIIITFNDDEEALTSMIMNMQLMRQLNKHVDVYGLWSELNQDYKFDFKIEYFNSKKQVVEGYVYKDAFISSLEYSSPNIQSDEDSEITITIMYDNVDILMYDTYVSLFSNS